MDYKGHEGACWVTGSAVLPAVLTALRVCQHSPRPTCTELESSTRVPTLTTSYVHRTGELYACANTHHVLRAQNWRALDVCQHSPRPTCTELESSSRV